MTSRLKTWRQAIRNGLVSGTVASIASTISLSVLGRIELGKTAAPINGPSQWIWGRHAPFENRFSLRYTVAGYAIHHAASMFWAIFHEKLRQHLPRMEERSALGSAIAITTAAYLVDFNLTPKRLTPGFEKRLSKHALFIVYGIFALGLATGALICHCAPSSRRSRDFQKLRSLHRHL